MGHLSKKYNEEYFLGSMDELTHQEYGLSGYAEFKANIIHQRFIDTLTFTKSIVGDFKGKNVLEIGFGRGEMIPLLLKEDINYYHGIDISSTAMNIAQDRYSDPKVKLEQKDATELTEENFYDIIILNHMVEYIPIFEMDVIWTKIKRALRSSGLIILGTKLYKNPNELDNEETIHPTMGMNCNKQTVNSIVKICDEYDLMCVKWDNMHFGLIRKEDSHLNNYSINKDLIKLQKPQKAGRLLIGCVAENNAKFREQALRLVQSLRWFGGEMAGANFLVCMVDEVDPIFVEELEKWGAFVRIVSRFNIEHAPSNKFRFLELPETKFYDTIMLMDCDTVIVQDPSKHILGDKFQAAIAGRVSESYSSYKKIFNHYKLPIPPLEFKTSISGESTIWYCNAGVLIFPKNILNSLLPVWKYYVNDLCENKHLLSRFFFCEQVALSLAYYTEKIPFEQLPDEMNYHLNPKIVYKGKYSSPFIIHYHKYTNKKGFLLETTKDLKLLKMVKKFNQRLKLYKKNLENS